MLFPHPYTFWFKIEIFWSSIIRENYLANFGNKYFGQMNLNDQQIHPVIDLNEYNNLYIYILYYIFDCPINFVVTWYTVRYVCYLKLIVYFIIIEFLFLFPKNAITYFCLCIFLPKPSFNYYRYWLSNNFLIIWF